MRWPSVEALALLRRQLDDDVDVGPDDRARALAALGLYKVVTLAVAVVAFPVGLFMPAAVLLWWLDAGSSAAAAVGILGVALSMLLPATVGVVGRALQIRHLRAVLWRVTERRLRLIDGGSAGGGASPVAVSVRR